MEIRIGYGFNDDNNINKEESDILEQMIPNLNVMYPDKLKIVANTTDYTTLQYNDLDIIRVKSTLSTQWLKIRVSTKVRKEQAEKPLFNEQVKKTETMWKCRVSDIDKLYPYINDSIKEIFKEQ